MKTFIEWNTPKGSYTEKLATLEAKMVDGTVLGSAEINLSDFAKPDKYLKSLVLQNADSSIGAGSFISIEIKSADASKDSSPTKRASMVNSISSRMSTMLKPQNNS